VATSTAISTRARRWSGFPALAAAVLLLAPASLPAAKGTLPDFRTIIEKNGPAVVSINTVRDVQAMGGPQRGPGGPGQMPQIPDFLQKFFDQLPQMPRPDRSPVSGIGSGFIISADGYVVSNAHVVAGAEEITVTTADRKELSAELVGMDKRTDLALLKVEGSDLPHLEFGDSSGVEVGQWVLAIGNPFGLEYTATQGIVSGLGRSLPRENYTPFIQTDVAVNPGSSGGPLFDLQGNVIGINSQIFSRTGGYMGLSFAIPSDIAADVIEQLKTEGRVLRGWLGVTIQDLDQALAESFGLDGPKGALVADVMEGGPAAGAGLRQGDVILAYDGERLQRSSELPPLVGGTRPGNEVELKILRGGERRTIEVTIGEFPEEGEQLAGGGAPDAGPQGGRLGLVIADLDPQQRKQLGIEGGGVLVRQVEPGSAAEQAGIKPNDVIVAFNQEQIDSSQELIELANNAPPGRSVAVLVIRKETPRFLALPIPEAEDVG